jgi:hypothetical protein
MQNSVKTKVGCVLAALLPILGHADSETIQQQQQQTPAATPWLTGPLIAPVGVAVTKGHYTFQPYFTSGFVTGAYNGHWKPVSKPNFYNVFLQFLALIGLTEFMDIQIFPGVLFNSTQGKSSTRFSDFPVTLDFQLVRANRFKWFPGIKLSITETFPTGKYQKLGLNKHDTDVSGLGSFSTAPGIVFYKIYHLSKQHFLSMTASFEYTYFVPVHVKELNVYGGGKGTRGKVYPGNLSIAIVSFEYTLTQNWALALDNVYTHVDKDRFRGNPGVNADDTPASVGRHSSEVPSFAPAIEYNFSENLGLIAGVWFSAAGRNFLEFRNGIVSFVASY